MSKANSVLTYSDRMTIYNEAVVTVMAGLKLMQGNAEQLAVQLCSSSRGVSWEEGCCLM